MKTALLTLMALAFLAPPQESERVTLPGLEDKNAGLSREDILKSPEWRKTMLTLSTWFDTQRMYSPEQVLDFKRRINQMAMESPPADLLRLQHNLTEKLAILNGPEALALKRWLREQMSLASDEYARRILAGLPDIARMTPSDLQQYLNEFEVRIGQQKRGRQEFLSAKSQQAQFVDSALTQQRVEADRAINSAVRSGSWGGNSGVIGSKNVTGGEIPTAAGTWNMNWGTGGWGSRW
jgi:hypothetical protein